jgi:Gpi18-like mannosyltransferase
MGQGMVYITLFNSVRITGKVTKPKINTWLRVKKNQYLTLAIVLLVSFIIRMYLSQFEGHGSDILLFKTWSRGVYYTGFSHFYYGIRSDYPPFYIYILWAIGTFYKSFISFSFDIDSPVFTILLKMPAILADIATALLIFLIVRKYGSFRLAFISMISYAFNPAIIYDSAIWGQVDSVYTLFFMLALMFFVSGKQMLSGVFIALAILTKPQSLVLAPLFALVMIKKNSPLTLAKISSASCAAFVVVALPFYLDTSILDLFKLYFMSYAQYPYNSLNAFNLWAFTGLFQPDNTQFLFMTYRMWGYLMFGLVFMYVSYFILKNKDDKSIYIACAILFFAFFMFFTRIHERYLFPMFAPLAVAMTLDRRFSYVYVLATLTFLFNLHFVLEESKTGIAFPDGEFLIPVTAGINLVLLIYTIYCYSTYNRNIKGVIEAPKISYISLSSL